MGPTKVIAKGDAIYDASTGQMIQEGLSTPEALQHYAAHHYLVLPEVDKSGRSWEWEGKLVYCLHGSRYEAADGQPLHLARCSSCGGMGVRIDEVTLERDCLRCTQCGHEFDARLEMMES